MACGKTSTASGEAPKRCGGTSKRWCEAPIGFGERAKRLGKDLDVFRVEASGFGVAPIGYGMTGNARRQPLIAMGEVPMGCGETPRDFDERWMDRAGMSTGCAKALMASGRAAMSCGKTLMASWKTAIVSGTTSIGMAEAPMGFGKPPAGLGGAPMSFGRRRSVWKSRRQAESAADRPWRAADEFRESPIEHGEALNVVERRP